MYYTVVEHCGCANLGGLVKSTAECRKRRRMCGPSARQVHIVHAYIEWEKRRDRSGTVDQQGNLT